MLTLLNLNKESTGILWSFSPVNFLCLMLCQDKMFEGRKEKIMMVMGHNYEQSTVIYMYRNIMMNPIVSYAKSEKFKEVSLAEAYCMPDIALSRATKSFNVNKISDLCGVFF